jgi:hypothetical protein
MFLECSLMGKELHSHSFSVSNHLFNFFTAESDETRRVREGSEFILMFQEFNQAT